MNRNQRRQAERQNDDSSLEYLRALAGQPVPGGCDDCDAYQTIHHMEDHTRITIHHDDTCPTLAAMEARR